jgi:hypothetical protein
MFILILNVNNLSFQSRGRQSKRRRRHPAEMMFPENEPLSIVQPAIVDCSMDNLDSPKQPKTQSTKFHGPHVQKADRAVEQIFDSHDISPR